MSFFRVHYFEESAFIHPLLRNYINCNQSFGLCCAKLRISKNVKKKVSDSAFPLSSYWREKKRDLLRGFFSLKKWWKAIKTSRLRLLQPQKVLRVCENENMILRNNVAKKFWIWVTFFKILMFYGIHGLSKIIIIARACILCEYIQSTMS